MRADQYWLKSSQQVCTPSLSHEPPMLPAHLTARSSDAWCQVMDDTYENFIYGSRPHIALNRPHILHIFSFSKVRFQMTRPGSMMSPHQAHSIVSHFAADLPVSHERSSLCPTCTTAKARGSACMHAAAGWQHERVLQQCSSRAWRVRCWWLDAWCAGAITTAMSTISSFCPNY